MKLSISAPSIAKNELKYTIDVVFKDFLGISYELNFTEREEIKISGNNDNSILVSADFFKKINVGWLDKDTLPKMPLDYYKNNDKQIFTENINIPVLYGNAEISQQDNDLAIGFDLFGTIFFFLSRYEEAIISDRDSHGRFMAKSSIAYKANFLHLPIVDAYCEILWSSIKFIFPSIERKNSHFKNIITCDVDFPLRPATTNFFAMLKSAAKQLLNLNLFNFLKLIKNYMKYKLKKDLEDDYEEKIKWIIDENDKHKNTVLFNFIPQKTSKFDPDTNLSNERVKSMVNLISSSNHIIGIHPGYNTYKNIDLFSKSIDTFQNVLEGLSISQEATYGRHHFLRWDVMETPLLWERHNINYDSSLGFADIAGFRCGTSKIFKMYSLKERCPLNLRQVPLIAMESTIISKKYENLGMGSNALARFEELQKQCEKYKGNFTLLWHNSSLESQKHKQIYKKLISKK